jgi:hypothetical protein
VCTLCSVHWCRIRSITWNVSDISETKRASANLSNLLVKTWRQSSAVPGVNNALLLPPEKGLHAQCTTSTANSINTNLGLHFIPDRCTLQLVRGGGDCWLTKLCKASAVTEQKSLLMRGYPFGIKVQTRPADCITHICVETVELIQYKTCRKLQHLGCWFAQFTCLSAQPCPSCSEHISADCVCCTYPKVWLHQWTRAVKYRWNIR